MWSNILRRVTTVNRSLTLTGVAGGMDILIGLLSIGGHNMIAPQNVDDDLWVLMFSEIVDGAMVLLGEHGAQKTFHTGEVHSAILIQKSLSSRYQRLIADIEGVRNDT